MTEATAPTHLAAYMRAKQELVEHQLDGLLPRPDGDADRAGCPARLAAAMRYSVMAGGKRLRPLLVLMAAEAAGGVEAAALPAACALEMVHTYSLIHDDLPAMDDDDLRRGRPTCHKVYGEALAILAGDALLTLAFETLARRPASGRVAAACVAELAVAAGAAGMVGGQVADLAAEHGGGGLADLEAIHVRKTGALLRAALRIGAHTAGASAAVLEALTEYGHHLGLAFQIQDDLLDVQGDAAKLGKRVRKDSAQGKLTYPALLGVEASRRRAAALCGRACAALGPLDARAERLRALARYIIERDR